MRHSALVIYEHACTLSQEADVIWSRKKTGATLLFLLNRFATAGFAVAMMILIPNWDTLLACWTVNLLLPAFQLILSIIWAAFSALRVFAITRCDWWISTFVFALGLVPVGTNLVSPSLVICVHILELTSKQVSDIRQTRALTSSELIVMIITRSCLIAADILVLIVTWKHTYILTRQAHAASLRSPMVTLLLRDGA
ncbi:hypothetical protein FOMPIDRAFT_49807 [Fomitopsis schrenkii]|uniref:DUF6533 domain-containing protein n=1 Tax=Fomitopsis schrenkii TaxID=2126942 RepID=S8DPF5_FOMSC|nr:hypothetical protein FOMPIDRAFT_49807 [Fomitopsis schrenkii]